MVRIGSVVVAAGMLLTGHSVAASPLSKVEKDTSTLASVTLSNCTLTIGKTRSEKEAQAVGCLKKAEAYFTAAKTGDRDTKQSSLDLAQRFVKGAIKLDDSQPAAFIVYGEILTAAGKNVEAEEQFKAAIGLDCHSIDAWSFRAQAMEMRKEYYIAGQFHRQVAALMNDEIVAYQGCISIYEQLGKLNKLHEEIMYVEGLIENKEREAIRVAEARATSGGVVIHTPVIASHGPVRTDNQPGRVGGVKKIKTASYNRNKDKRGTGKVRPVPPSFFEALFSGTTSSAGGPSW